MCARTHVASARTHKRNGRAVVSLCSHTALPMCSLFLLKLCATTSLALLCARYKLAATRANFIPWTLPDGTHLDYAMLPKKLKAANYRSYHIGKWHQGIYTPEYEASSSFALINSDASASIARI